LIIALAVSDGDGSKQTGRRGEVEEKPRSRVAIRRRKKEKKKMGSNRSMTLSRR
jgi:hypothetical protein